VGGLGSGEGAYVLASFVSGFAAFGPAMSEPPNLSIYAIKYHRVLRLQSVFFLEKKRLILTTTSKKIRFSVPGSRRGTQLPKKWFSLDFGRPRVEMFWLSVCDYHNASVD
jgi:hypothetical protein